MIGFIEEVGERSDDHTERFDMRSKLGYISTGYGTENRMIGLTMTDHILIILFLFLVGNVK